MLAAKPYKDEMLDVIDWEGKVLYQAPFSKVHSEGLVHRAVHVLLFRRPDMYEMLRSLRGKNVDHPFLYTSSAAGHPVSGQTSIEGARTELEEELFYAIGLPPGLELREFATYRKETRPTDKELVTAYLAVYGGAISPNPAEIQRAEWVETDAVAQDIILRPEAYSGSLQADMRELLRYLGKQHDF